MSFAMPDCNNPIIKKYKKQGFENLEKLKKFKKGGQMENLKEANEEIERLKDEIKKIKEKNIKDFSTKDLCDELTYRGGVDKYWVHPYDETEIKIEDKIIKFTGPADIFVVID